MTISVAFRLQYTLFAHPESLLPVILNEVKDLIVTRHTVAEMAQKHAFDKHLEAFHVKSLVKSVFLCHFCHCVTSNDLIRKLEQGFFVTLRMTRRAV